MRGKKTCFWMSNALAVNVIEILEESEETTFYGCNRTSCKPQRFQKKVKKQLFFGCNRTSCKRYYNLRFQKVKKVFDVIALAVNVRDFRRK